MKILKFAYVLLLIVLSIFETFGQALITDRPDQTESSVSVPKKSLQIECGFQYGNLKEKDVSVEDVLLPTVLFRYGLFKGFELRLVAQIERLKETGSDDILGFSDMEIGGKIEILNNEDINTQIAFLSHLILLTGTKGLTGDKFGVVNKLAFSHDINDAISAGYNVGYDYFGEGKGIPGFSLSFGFSLSDKISVYVEPYGDYFNFERFILNSDAGITYLLKQNFQLDFSAGIGINHKMNYLAVGFSWRI
jgi:hypothetical protein